MRELFSKFPLFKNEDSFQCSLSYASLELCSFAVICEIFEAII